MPLELDQKVVWWKGPAAGRLTAIHCSVHNQRDARVQVLLEEGARRWVDLDRIQPVCRFYYSWVAPDYTFYEPPTDKWGGYTVYCETHEDLFPNRWVYRFACGKYLRYDREHWFDNYGALGTGAYCHFRFTKEKAGTLISEVAFLEHWERAGEHDDDVAKLDRETPGPLRKIKPWTRRPIQIG